jgi:hypothetical protein
MSQRLIGRSQDLKQLRDEGYSVEIRSGHLLLHDVPYVIASREVARGTLVSTLTMAGDVTAPPDTHVAMFIGEYPCDAEGRPLEAIRNSVGQQLAPDLAVDWMFSSKPVPAGAYADYHEKMTAYVRILAGHARAIDPSATAQTYAVIEADPNESVFHYLDTATSRAGIGVAAEKLSLGKVAIVGTGGTGSYILDLVAKTEVREIHLLDGDDFLSHNAFRAPGAAALEVLHRTPKKVTYLAELYAAMRRGVIPHPYDIAQSNVDELGEMDFVFLCIDPRPAKRLVVETLERCGVPFIDVGMGVELVEGSLRGTLRVTTSTPDRRDHFRFRAPLADAGLGDEYNANIQVADLNALNATLAVIRWKRLYGFYLDFRGEHHSTYTIDVNMLLSEDSDESSR